MMSIYKESVTQCWRSFLVVGKWARRKQTMLVNQDKATPSLFPNVGNS
jgi:hypothetical protein